eukprot:1188861-Prorocentrum_minimum.AAC.1
MQTVRRPLGAGMSTDSTTPPLPPARQTSKTWQSGAAANQHSRPCRVIRRLAWNINVSSADWLVRGG